MDVNQTNPHHERRWMILGVIGLAHHYRQRPPYRLVLGLVAASLLLNLAILDWPRASFERKPAQLVLNILRGRGTGRLLMQ